MKPQQATGPTEPRTDEGARATDVTSQKDSAQGIQWEWDLIEVIYGDGTLQTHSPTKSLVQVCGTTTGT